MASTPKKPIRLCLNLNNRAHIGRNEFKNVLAAPKQSLRTIIRSMSFKFFSNTSPAYMNDVFKPVGQPSTTTMAPLLKVSQPIQKTQSQSEEYFICSTNYLE